MPIGKKKQRYGRGSRGMFGEEGGGHTSVVEKSDRINGGGGKRAVNYPQKWVGIGSTKTRCRTGTRNMRWGPTKRITKHRYSEGSQHQEIQKSMGGPCVSVKPISQKGRYEALHDRDRSAGSVIKRGIQNRVVLLRNNP